MKALDGLLELGFILIAVLLVLALYERSIAARNASSQTVALAGLESNAGNSLINALFNNGNSNGGAG